MGAMRARMLLAVVGAGTAAVLGGLAGCGGSGAPRESDGGSAEPVNTGLSALMSGDRAMPPARLPDPEARPDVGHLAAQAAMDLESLINSGSLDPRRRGGAAAGAETTRPGGAEIYGSGADAEALAAAEAVWVNAAEASRVEPVGDVAAEPKVAVGVPEPAPVVKSPEDELVELAGTIASVMRRKAAEAGGGEGGTGKGEMNDAVALAPIEALRPGTLGELDDPAGLLASRLSEADLETLRSARDRLIASPEAADRAFARSIGAILPEEGLTIGVAELCTRVTAFGRYVPFPNRVFAAGQAHRMIVYTEIDGFTYRGARHSDPVAQSVPLDEQESVELSQSVTLYQADGYQAWHKPAETVIETTRGRRRDFYLVQLIELPRTLAAGQYNLKVTVKDKVSGAETERVIPLELKAYN